MSNTSDGSGGLEADDRLFKPFARDDGAGDGSGLGLSICRRVVEHHRGDIWLEPGSDRFTVSFTLGEQT